MGKVVFEDICVDYHGQKRDEKDNAWQCLKIKKPGPVGRSFYPHIFLYLEMENVMKFLP